jgi:predicted DNA-binding transcriptional regulator AlpA
MKKPKATATPGGRFLRARDLMERYQVSRVTLWAWERAGILPRGVLLGPNTKGWALSAIEEFERRRAEAKAA